MFGNLLYSSSRSQKALALSSCEAEVYAGTSATSDAVLMYHCICFCVGPNETVKVKLALDNAAGIKFLPPFRCWTDQAHQFACAVDATEGAGKVSFSWACQYKTKPE